MVWGGRWDLNPRHSEPQSDALPAELLPPLIDYKQFTPLPLGGKARGWAKHINFVKDNVAAVQEGRGRIENPPSLFQRCGQPGQQQGRRIPSLSSVRTRSMCCLLVSGFLTEITQQIHSLRASGVISSHFALATGSEMRAFRKSAGKLCTAPAEIAFLLMDFILPCTQSVSRVLGCNQPVTADWSGGFVYGPGNQFI